MKIQMNAVVLTEYNYNEAVSYIKCEGVYNVNAPENWMYTETQTLIYSRRNYALRYYLSNNTKKFYLLEGVAGDVSVTDKPSVHNKKPKQITYDECVQKAKYILNKSVVNNCSNSGKLQYVTGNNVSPHAEITAHEIVFTNNCANVWVYCKVNGIPTYNNLHKEIQNFDVLYSHPFVKTSDLTVEHLANLLLITSVEFDLSNDYVEIVCDVNNYTQLEQVVLHAYDYGYYKFNQNANIFRFDLKQFKDWKFVDELIVLINKTRIKI